MGALGAAISGMGAAQKWLDVISNNVSNSQTVAYKGGRASFSDLVSEGLRSPSGPSRANNLGGVNPSQLGLGVQVSTIQTMMKQGATLVTGNASDVAVQGSGFITVQKGIETLYTRAGNLTFDQQGNLVTVDGGQVQGWTLQTTRTGPPVIVTGTALNTTVQPGNIQVPKNLVLGPSATTNQLSPAIKDEGVIIKGNLDNRTPQNPLAGYGGFGAPNGFVPDATVSFTVYDSLGTSYDMLLAFRQTAATPGVAASWAWSLHDVTGGRQPDSSPWSPGGATGNMVMASGANITFNSDGSLANNGSAVAGTNVTVAMALTNGAQAPFNFALNFGTDNNAAPGGIGFRDGLTGDDGNGTFDPITGAYLPVQTAYSSFVDGYPEGTLTGYSFNQTGGIDVSFSNNQTIEYAKLAMSAFDNPDGLEKVGGNYFRQTANSGLARTGEAGSAGFGTIQGGALEQSNVDLTIELTNMIVAQRMFESNARIVTAADRVLDTLVNLGRG